jgi:pyridoxamine 5'-phosphate oxidase
VDPGLLAAMRRNYTEHGLDESELDPDPFVQFGRWLDEVIRLDLPEPNAMVLSTADATGAPSARTVLLKAYDAHGFVFYTNYTSTKAVEMAANPRVALVFPWHAISRQVLVSGAAGRVSPAESAAYVATRPRSSQLAAWASRQSAELPSRAVLEARLAELAERFPPGQTVPVPDFWGGIRVVPETVEFWQGRPGRLHDRLRYYREASGWRVRRLSP